MNGGFDPDVGIVGIVGIYACPGSTSPFCYASNSSQRQTPTQIESGMSEKEHYQKNERQSRLSKKGSECGSDEVVMNHTDVG